MIKYYEKSIPYLCFKMEINYFKKVTILIEILVKLKEQISQ